MLFAISYYADPDWNLKQTWWQIFCKTQISSSDENLKLSETSPRNQRLKVIEKFIYDVINTTCKQDIVNGPNSTVTTVVLC